MARYCLSPALNPLEEAAPMKLFIAAAAVMFVLVTVTTQDPDAPAGFDNKPNGMVDDATHQADQAKFDEVEQLSDGLGPLYNAQSCRECHQNPVSGAAPPRSRNCASGTTDLTDASALRTFR